MLNVCAIYNLYDEDFWLPYSVASIYDAVPKIFFVLNHKSWYGSQNGQESTKNCIKSLADPQKKFSVIEGLWNSEDEQRNFNLKLAIQNQFQAALIIDADEIYETSQVTEMFQHASRNPEIDCWHIHWVTYWKSVKFRIDPLEGYQPAVLLMPESCRYVETRNPLGRKHALIPPSCAICHHMSYALRDEQILRKHISFSGHSQSSVQGWFETVWKAWDSNQWLENLHPVNPTDFKRAVPVTVDILPKTIRPLFEGIGLP